VVPMWTISQMARGLYRCNSEQNPSNLCSLMQHCTGVFLERVKRKRRGMGNQSCPLVFLKAIMINESLGFSRSVFCTNNNKNGNIYMQIQAPVKKLLRQLQNLTSVTIFHIVEGRKPILANHLLKRSQNLFH